MTAEGAFDPRTMLAALERNRVNYVVIGAVARVLHGTDEVTSGLDICPQRRDENMARLDAALAELGTEPFAPRATAEEVVARRTGAGLLQIVPVPAGTRGGWDDLRRHANREAIGEGLRVPVTSLDDLLRMSAALNRARDLDAVPRMRRLADHERGLSR